MSRLVQHGRYLDLISMDKHFHDISIALHVREEGNTHQFILHTYSRLSGSRERIRALADLLVALGGMERIDPKGDLLCFPCGALHERGVKRLFNEVVALSPSTPPQAGPLSLKDPKTGGTVRVEPQNDPQGGWTYQIRADGKPEQTERRVAEVTGGLCKLGDLERVVGTRDRVRFTCGRDHRGVVGVLLPKALNLRSVIAAEEAELRRGLLLAPSAQAEQP